MGLTIVKEQQTNTGINITGMYIRLNTLESADGTSIKVANMCYSNKAAFTGNLAQVLTSLPMNATFTYNRVTDGSDILAFAQSKMKAYIIETSDLVDSDIILDVLP